MCAITYTKCCSILELIVFLEYPRVNDLMLHMSDGYLQQQLDITKNQISIWRYFKFFQFQIWSCYILLKSTPMVLVDGKTMKLQNQSAFLLTHAKYHITFKTLLQEWDEELARVAQRHADQCVFAHDCSKCRKIRKFPSPDTETVCT